MINHTLGNCDSSKRKCFSGIPSGVVVYVLNFDIVIGGFELHCPTRFLNCI